MSNETTAPTERSTRTRTHIHTPLTLTLVRLVSFVGGAIEVFIALRFALKLFQANPESAFVQLVYSVSGLFMGPFNAVFKTQHVSGSAFEWSALVAIAAYALITWGLVTLIRVLSPRLSTDTVRTVEKDAATQ